MPVDSIGNSANSALPQRSTNPAELLREQRVDSTPDPAQRQLQEPQRSQEVVQETSTAQRADQQRPEPEIRRPVETAGERNADAQDQAQVRQQRLDQAISNSREPAQARQQIDELA